MSALLPFPRICLLIQHSTGGCQAAGRAAKIVMVLFHHLVAEIVTHPESDYESLLGKFFSVAEQPRATWKSRRHFQSFSILPPHLLLPHWRPRSPITLPSSMMEMSSPWAGPILRLWSRLARRQRRLCRPASRRIHRRVIGGEGVSTRILRARSDPSRPGCGQPAEEETPKVRRLKERHQVLMRVYLCMWTLALLEFLRATSAHDAIPRCPPLVSVLASLFSSPVSNDFSTIYPPPRLNRISTKHKRRRFTSRHSLTKGRLSNFTNDYCLPRWLLFYRCQKSNFFPATSAYVHNQHLR